MIYSLNGVLIDRNLSSVVIECGGVGYKCIVTDQTLRQLPETGLKLFLYTYMNVREDAVDLFGFITKDEMEMFRLLISVNGVGPKAAIVFSAGDCYNERKYLPLAAAAPAKGTAGPDGRKTREGGTRGCV